MTLQSIKFGCRAATRNYLVLSDSADSTKASTNRTYNSTTDSSFGNVAWVKYDFNDLELDVGQTYNAHFRDANTGSAQNQTEDVNLMQISNIEGYKVFATSGYSTTRVMYYEVKCTVSSLPSATLPTPSFEQLGTSMAPDAYSTWFTSWDGEGFSNECKGIGPNAIGNVYVADKEESVSRTPYKDFQAPSDFSVAIYADASLVAPYEDEKEPVLWTFGKAGDANLRLRKDMDHDKLQLVAGNGASSVATVEIDIPTGGGYHLYTATFSTTGGISLTIDGNTASKVSDASVCTCPVSGFQIGGMYQGCVSGETQVKHMPIVALLGYDNVLSDSDIEALADEYPASSVVTGSSVMSYSVNNGKLYSGTMTNETQRLELDVGTLCIPEDQTLTIKSLRVGNSSSGNAYGIELDGTLKISGTSSASDATTIRNNVIANTGGVLLGEWTGSGTYNIRGLLDAENNYMLLYYDAAAQTYNVDGGTIKAKALQCRAFNSGRSGSATVNLTNGGMIEVAEVLSAANAYTRNYGYGTLRYTGNATEVLSINFNAGTGYATTLDPAANTLTLSAGVVTGTGDIAVAPSGAGKVVFASLTDSYSGKVTISSGSAEIQGVSGYMGDIEANAPLTIATGANDVTMASAISGTGAINKTGTGTLTITGSGTSSGNVTINGGKLVLSGNEAKIGTGHFDIKPGSGKSATLEVAPGVGNTITLAPDFIVNSTDGTPYLVVGPGTFAVASTGSSSKGHLGSCTTTIKDGGILKLTKSGLLGTDVSYGITVEDGGKLQMAAYQKLARNVTLNGGSIELTGASTPLEFWGAKTVTATADSEIQAVSSGSNTNPNMWINSNADGVKVAVTFNVSSSAATLDVNACIVNGNAANSQGNGITKTGAGTLALNGYNGNGYSYSGTTTVSAGTLKINAQQSGSAYDLAAGTTLKFGTGANLSAPSLTLPDSGTVTVDVSDLTLSASGTTLMTFTTPPSADDVANKMSASGAVLVLEGSTLKAYPVATLTYTENDVTTTNSYSTLNDAISAAYIREYMGNSYDYITINQSGTATAYSESIKVKLASGVTFTINPGSPENGAYTAGSADENGVITYTTTPQAMTYVWVAANGGQWNLIGNWKYIDGEDVQQWATRCPTSVDTVIFNDGATVTLNDTVTVAGIEVNGDVSISATAKSLNTSGNVTTSSSGTLTLSDVCLASAAAGVTVAPAVNFTNDSELAGENALTLLGNVTVFDTFKVWNSSHVISGPVTINSGVTFTYGALLQINGAATIKGAYTRSTASMSCIKFSGVVTNESGNVSIDGWKDGSLADSATVVLAGAGASLTDTRGTPIADNKVSTSVADSYVKKTGSTFAVAAKTVVSVSVGSNVSLTINGNAVADGDTFKFIPGDTFTYAATPAANYTANVAVTGGTDNDGTVTVGETAITVAATATCNGATVSNVAVSYGPDYTSATVTATVSDSKLDYYISWASGEPVKGTVSGSTVTFDVSGIAHSAPYQSSGYNISAKDGETTVTTTGGAGSTVAADVIAAGWINENATTTGTSAGGAWEPAVTYANGAAEVSDNKFSATTASTSSRVVLEFDICFAGATDDAVDGDAQAAIKIGTVNDAPTFMVLTNANTWAAVSHADLVADPAATNKVVLTIDYGTKTYDASVAGLPLTNSVGSARFPLAASRTNVKDIDFAGSGVVKSIKGDQVEGYMVKDGQNNFYPTIEAATQAYSSANGPYTVLHPGTPPDGWQIVNDVLKKVVKGFLLIAF